MDWPVGGWLPHLPPTGRFWTNLPRTGHPFSDDPALNEPSLVPFTSETRPGRPRLDYVDARLVSSGGIRAIRRAVGRAARRCTRAGRRPGVHSAPGGASTIGAVRRVSSLIGRWRVIPRLAPVNGEAGRTSAHPLGEDGHGRDSTPNTDHRARRAQEHGGLYRCYRPFCLNRCDCH